MDLPSPQGTATRDDVVVSASANFSDWCEGVLTVWLSGFCQEKGLQDTTQLMHAMNIGNISVVAGHVLALVAADCQSLLATASALRQGPVPCSTEYFSMSGIAQPTYVFTALPMPPI